MFDLKKIEGIYHPFKINLKGNVAIFENIDGKHVLKKINKDLFSLYGYFDKIGFDLVPNLERNFDDKEYVEEYIDSVYLPFEQYYESMGRDLGLLHSKTVYDKNVSIDEIKKLKETIEDNIVFLENKYTSYFKSILLKEYYSPSEYLFMRNFSLIKGSLNKTFDLLNSWFENVLNDKTMRVCLLHNNVSKEHYIASKDKNYFISFDNYSFDLPVFDLVQAFKNIYEDNMFMIFYKSYSLEFDLLDKEKDLFNILLNIPFDIELNNDYLNYQKLFFYINKVNEFTNTFDK